jgi:hypothetical protein
MPLSMQNGFSPIIIKCYMLQTRLVYRYQKVITFAIPTDPYLAIRRQT